MWTLKLRDGVLFQSGNPMDAEAVKASLERTCSMQSRADGELGIASMEADGNVVADFEEGALFIDESSKDESTDNED